MNVDRLQQIGRPPAPALTWAGADELRRAFCREYDQRRAAELGEISAYGSRHVAPPPIRLGGRYAASEARCGDCRAIRSPLASEPCANCGSTQPPDLSRLNPRHRHQAGESPLR